MQLFCRLLFLKSMVHFHLGLLERSSKEQTNRKTGSLISQLIEEATAPSDDFFLKFFKRIYTMFSM